MSFLKELFNSIARTLGRIIAYILIGFLIFFVFSKFTHAQETGWVFYNGQQQGQRFVFENADDVGQWTNINANVIRYDNDNLTMTSGNTYTFSIRFSILLQDDINTTTSISAQPAYVRNGGLNFFKDTTCNISYQSKILSTTSTKKTAEHYISVSCPDIKFSTGNNTMAVRFAVNNNNQYYNIIEMSRSNLVYKNNNSLTESDKIIISQNQNTNDIIDNQNQNTQDIINNQNQNQNQTNNRLEDINDTLTDSSVPSVDNVPTFEFNNGPVSGLLTMPITWFNAFINPGTCRDISLGSLLGTELKFSCINPEKYLGSSIWGTIDIFIVVMMIISISSMVLHIVDSFRNLNDMYDEYYTPKHQGYRTRHNGERV